MVSRVLAGCVALTAFAGLASGNEAGAILVRAIMAMILCYPVGLVVGMICERVIAMHSPSPDEENESEDERDPSESDAAKAPAEEVSTV